MTVKKNIKKNIIQNWKKGDKKRTIRVIGTSMRPLIVEGNSITFSALGSSQKLVIGDIAVFHRGEGIIAHRIVGHYSYNNTISYMEKGDNTFFPLLLSSSDIIGKVVKIHSNDATIDLRTWKWILVNRFFGYYWNILFALLRPIRSVSSKLFGPSRQNYMPRYRRYLYLIIKLPVRCLAKIIHQ